MKFLHRPVLWTAIWMMALAPAMPSAMLWAQNLGAAPATNVAVQGETAAQPEGTFLNFINWIGNVIAPVAAGGAVVGAVAAWLTGRGVVWKWDWCKPTTYRSMAVSLRRMRGNKVGSRASS
jgi:hypothetical protein